MAPEVWNHKWVLLLVASSIVPALVADKTVPPSVADKTVLVPYADKICLLGWDTMTEAKNHLQKIG